MKNLEQYGSIAVVIPCYCAHRVVDRCLRSVMSQTILPRQIILVDDASPDNGLTVRALRRLKDEFSSTTRIDIVLLPKNSGPSGARNAGWDLSEQEFVAFLDADD